MHPNMIDRSIVGGGSLVQTPAACFAEVDRGMARHLRVSGALRRSRCPAGFPLCAAERAGLSELLSAGLSKLAVLLPGFHRRGLRAPGLDRPDRPEVDLSRRLSRTMVQRRRWRSPDRK